MWSIILNRGDLLIFDGLTFHRTYSTEKMTGHRDALLVRLVKPQDRHNFVNRNDKVKGLNIQHDYSRNSRRTSKANKMQSQKYIENELARELDSQGFLDQILRKEF